MMKTIDDFLLEWGYKLSLKIQEQLEKPVQYAPGYNGDAYSNGRNKSYMGAAPKSAMGDPLYNSVYFNVKNETLSIEMNYYWKYVEYGRKPGKYVPIKPLEEWARSKGFSNPRSAAFAISRNIFKFGVKPTNFYGTSIDKITELLDTEFKDDVDFYLDLLLDSIKEKDLEIDIRI